MEVWKYNQRIDVEAWEYYFPGGVQEKGLDRVPVNEKTCAVFPIRKKLFETIKKGLKVRGGKGKL
jgi:hypothetical protein